MCMCLQLCVAVCMRDMCVFLSAYVPVVCASSFFVVYLFVSACVYLCVYVCARTCVSVCVSPIVIFYLFPSFDSFSRLQFTPCNCRI